MFSKHLGDAVTMLGQTFFYGGNAYVGVITPIETSHELNGDGLLDYTVDTKVIVLKKDFEQSPKSGERLSVGDKELRITKVSESEISFELTCITAKK